VVEPVAKTDVSQRPDGPASPLRRRYVQRHQRRFDVLLRRQGGDEVEGLEDEADRGGPDPAELTLMQ